MSSKRQFLTAETTINAAIDKVWKVWTTPADIKHWNTPFDGWHSPKVELDLKAEGHFLYRMEAKDGSGGFDHAGKYDKVVPQALIEYTVDDGRKSIIQFLAKGNQTTVVEQFEPEAQTPIDVQQDFCQKILDKFKNYTESNEF